MIVIVNMPIVIYILEFRSRDSAGSLKMLLHASRLTHRIMYCTKEELTSCSTMSREEEDLTGCARMQYIDFLSIKSLAGPAPKCPRQISPEN